MTAKKESPKKENNKEQAPPKVEAPKSVDLSKSELTELSNLFRDKQSIIQLANMYARTANVITEFLDRRAKEIARGKGLDGTSFTIDAQKKQLVLKD